MDKKICLITGATGGVGKATAARLAGQGFAVVMVARDAGKATSVQREIVAATGNPSVDYLVADLKSLQQVRQLAAAFRERYARLDVLINNAGVFMPARAITADGFETTYQINYLSHFLLTHLLLDELRKSEQGRVINLTSSVYTAGKFDADNLQSERRFSVMGTYAASKLLMLLFTVGLAEKLSGTGITANAVHPGIARTNMMLRAPGVFKVISWLALPFSVSAESGAATSVYLASSRDVRGVSGAYFANCQAKEVKTYFNTKQNRELLWKKSMESLQGLANG